jgi:hypothetical protein
MKSVHPAILTRIHEIEADTPGCLTTIYDPAVRCVYASPNHIESGWTQKDMLGSHWSKFIVSGDEPHGALAWNDVVLNDESSEISVTGLTKYGQRVRMKVRGWLMPHPVTGEPYVLVRSVLIDRPTPRRSLSQP